jgi:site-specific DNA-cytosine methylase
LNVDFTKEFLSFISFCTGYGGIEIGVERSLTPIPLKPVTLVEIEAFAITNLVAKMEAGLLAPTPIWTDLKTLHAYALRGLVDILMAGYPCQPFSNAGKRKGKEDPRHLWPWIREHIKAFLPTVCLFENVPGHVSLGLREVLTDLAELGYRVDNDAEEPTVGIFSAEECGAPHRRERLFILAYREYSERWPHIKKAIEQNWANRGWEETPGWARTCCPALAHPDSPGGSFCGKNGGMGRQPESYQKLADPELGRLQAGPVDRADLPGCCGKRGKSTNHKPKIEESSQSIPNPCRQGLPSPECKIIQGPWRRVKGGTAQQLCGSLLPARPGEPQHWWEEPRLLANTGLQRPEVCEQQAAGPKQQGGRDMDNADHGRCERQKGQVCPGGNWSVSPGQGPIECKLGRTAYGPAGGVDPAANRVDRLRLCGNGVYPDSAEKAFYTLMNKVINPNKAYVAPSVQLELFA